MTTSPLMSFGKALDILKDQQPPNGWTYFMTRPSWYGSEAKPKVFLQRPDEHSKMTMPYLYMEKDEHHSKHVIGETVKKVRFPLDLSCESILADDWVVNAINKAGQVKVGANQDHLGDPA